MSEGESARSGTALARRFYLHLQAGGQLKPHDLSLLVKALEGKDREIATLRTQLEEARRALGEAMAGTEGEESNG